MKGMIKDYKCIFKIFLIFLLFSLLSACGAVPTGPVITSFTADPTTIEEGGSSTLSWVTNATTVSINHAVGTVTAPSGSISVSPAETITYTLTATNSAGSVTANVIVTVSTALPKIIDVVKKDILPNIPEVQIGNPYRCLLLEDPIPAGTLIEEASDLPIRAKANIVLQKKMYFFYLDLAPGAYYAHPVKYLLVDEEGNHETYDAKWWPRIGGEVPASLLKDIPDKKNIIASNIELIYPIGRVTDYILPALISQWSEGFIVVQGLMTTENCYNDAVNSYSNVINFFNAYKNPFSRVKGLVQSQAAKVLDEIDQMAKEGKSVITIYIIAHGDVNWVSLGGKWFSATQFKNKMALYPNVKFNFMLGSCCSGSFIDDLSVLDNVYTVVTACSSNESAYGDVDVVESFSDVNPSDVGSEWTSSIIEAMDTIASDSKKMDSIYVWARYHDVPVTSMLIYQGGYGALGAQSSLGLTDNLDLTNIVRWSTPQFYCSYVLPFYQMFQL